MYTTLEKWIRSHRAVLDKETTADANGDRRRDCGIPLEHSTCEEYLITVVNLLITNVSPRLPALHAPLVAAALFVHYAY